MPCCLLKVITFYEPLKPFVAIVIEVTVLVAAILLYENSCSKKTSPAGNLGSLEQINPTDVSDCCNLMSTVCLIFRRGEQRPNQRTVSINMTSAFFVLVFGVFCCLAGIFLCFV